MQKLQLYIYVYQSYARNTIGSTVLRKLDLKALNGQLSHVPKAEQNN